MLVLFPARRSDDEAASRALAAAALPMLETRFDTGLLLGLEAWRTADTPEARGAALTALQRTDRVRALLRNRTGGEVTAVARGGDLLAVADGTAVTLFHGRPRLPERLVSPDGTEPTAVAVSAGGDRVAAAFGGDVLLYARGGGQIRLDGRVTSLAFSPDGTLLAGAGPRQLRVWDAGGQELHAQTLPRERAGTAAARPLRRAGTHAGRDPRRPPDDLGGGELAARALAPRSPRARAVRDAQPGPAATSPAARCGGSAPTRRHRSAARTPRSARTPGASPSRCRTARSGSGTCAADDRTATR